MGSLTVSTHGTAVVFSALDRAAPALGMSVTRREGRHLLAIDQNSLRVVSTSIVEFVWSKVSILKIEEKTMLLALTVHGHFVASFGSRRRVLHGHLRVRLTL